MSNSCPYVLAVLRTRCISVKNQPYSFVFHRSDYLLMTNWPLMLRNTIFSNISYALSVFVDVIRADSVCLGSRTVRTPLKTPSPQDQRFRLMAAERPHKCPEALSCKPSFTNRAHMLTCPLPFDEDPYICISSLSDHLMRRNMTFFLN